MMDALIEAVSIGPGPLVVATAVAAVLTAATLPHREDPHHE